jgi:membrane associated rhomboid family serine protease
MVFPLFDDNTDRRTFPGVNSVLIALNVLVFFTFQGGGPEFGSEAGARFTMAFSCVPEEIVTGKDLVTDDKEVRLKTGAVLRMPGLEPLPFDFPGAVYITLLSSMFMHGGLAHLLGNMLFLWIFGDNVEDDLGHERYLLFYLLTGVLASLAHVFTTYALGSDPRIPSLGASGAISGVLGAYLFLHPYRPVTVILLRILTQVPSWVAIGMWFAFQVISSIGVLGRGTQVGGVAYGAHIGGFVAGLALVQIFVLGRDRYAWQRRPPARRWWEH